MIPYKLAIKGQSFFIGDKPFKLRSGTIHYFRIHPSQWRDRLLKLKACGLNTVETYIAWNIQEPKKGEFVFDGTADFIEFIKTAEELGLYVIVRPGPFICAEWEMGGLPAWLTLTKDIELRRYNKPYLDCVDKYFDAVIPPLVPHLSTNGGGIIAVQVENEFGGSGASDPQYLEYLRDGLIRRGIDVLLFTSDGTWNDCLERGSIDGVFMTANFGSRYAECFDKLEALQPGLPKVCMEFWNGWFDQWGRAHHTRDVQSVVDELEGIISSGGHFNLYMFCGGTNFGFMNGSNCNPDFEPTITSYDYGAPLTEDGAITEQYLMIRRLIEKYDGVKLPPIPENDPHASYGTVTFSNGAPISDILPLLGDELHSDTPLSMEECGQMYGFILYRAEIKGMKGQLYIEEPHDRAMIYGDGKYLGLIERGGNRDEIYIENVKSIAVLVENMGRVNYGSKILDRKGLVGDILIGDDVVSGFTINTLPMEELCNLSLPSGGGFDAPAVYSADFIIDEDIHDTFVYPVGFTKGIVEINGFNLGRFFNAGPQQTLYVPAGVLKAGKNRICVFDLYPSSSPRVELIDTPILDDVK